MNQRNKTCEIIFLSLALFLSWGVHAEEGDLSGDEVNEIFEEAHHDSMETSQESSERGDLDGATTAAIPSAKSNFNDTMPSSDVGPREEVDDPEEAAAEINNMVGDSLTESNSFQSYTPEPEVTADRFIHGDGMFKASGDPGSFNYQPPKKKKKAKASKSKAKSKKKLVKKKSTKAKKYGKSSKPKKKSRRLASKKGV